MKFLMVSGISTAMGCFWEETTPIGRIYVLLLVWCPITKKVFHEIVFLNLYLLNRNRHQHQHPEDIEPKWRVQLRQQDRLPRSYRDTWSTRIMNQPPEEVLAILPCRLQVISNTVQLPYQDGAWVLQNIVWVKNNVFIQKTRSTLSYRVTTYSIIIKWM